MSGRIIHLETFLLKVVFIIVFAAFATEIKAIGTATTMKTDELACPLYPGELIKKELDAQLKGAP